MATAAPIGFAFDEAKHLYTDDSGAVIASVTQVLRAGGFLNYLDRIPAQILERKRRLGKLVHDASALLDRGEELADFDIPNEVYEYLEGYHQFKADTGFVPELVEHRQIGELLGMAFGMTLDRRGKLNGETHIIEIKCAATEHPAWGLQLAAYDVGLNNVPKMLRDKRVAVQLNPEFTRGYKLHPYNDPADYQIWCNELANTLWKQNHGILDVEGLPERLIA